MELLRADAMSISENTLECKREAEVNDHGRLILNKQS